MQGIGHLPFHRYTLYQSQFPAAAAWALLSCPEQESKQRSQPKGGAEVRIRLRCPAAASPVEAGLHLADRGTRCAFAASAPGGAKARGPPLGIPPGARWGAVPNWLRHLPGASAKGSIVRWRKMETGGAALGIRNLGHLPRPCGPPPPREGARAYGIRHSAFGIRNSALTMGIATGLRPSQ